MRAGTPGFIPGRLVQAREARGINTQQALASLIGKPRSTVSRWENNEATPEPEALDLLSERLNVRRSYFLRPMPDNTGKAFFARARKSVEKSIQSAERARLSWTIDISKVLQHYFVFPEYDLPRFTSGDGYKALRDEDIERIASEIRQCWRLGGGPITSMVSLLEAHGFVVANDEVGSSKLDGLCYWSEEDGRPYVLLATDKQSFFRTQMDAAHEMAHAVLHSELSQQQFEADFDFIETQAFRLASAFLMPATSFALEARFPTLNGLLAIKDRWKVSVKAMLKRCSDINVLSTEAVTQLYKHYSAKGWNSGEPMDREHPHDAPKLLARYIKELVQSGDRTKNDLLQSEFIVPAHDIEQLASLPVGWFGVEAEIVQLPIQRREPFKGRGEVVDLFSNKTRIS